MATRSSYSLPKTNTILDGIIDGSKWDASSGVITIAAAHNAYGRADDLYIPYPSTLISNLNFVANFLKKFLPIDFQVATTVYKNPLLSPANITFSPVIQYSALGFAAGFSSNTLGKAEFPDSNASGDFYPNHSGVDVFISYDELYSNPGETGAYVLFHELGHALGLKHPHDGGQYGRPTFNQLGIGLFDYGVMSVMSYENPANYAIDGYGAPFGFMGFDILALQKIYGKQTNTNLGDNVYQPSKLSSGYHDIWYSYYDCGGTDTLNFSSGTQGWRVALDAGFCATADGRSGAWFLTQNSSIESFLSFGENGYERVVGSPYDDIIRGNAANNTIDGGAGNDVVRFKSSFSATSYSYDSTSKNFRFSSLADGVDLISGVENFQFSDKSLTASQLIAGLNKTPPTIALSSDKTSLNASQTATISFSLSAPSTNFAASDVAVSGGTLSSFSGSGTVYSATFTPAPNSTADGVISVASGAFTDASGTANADGSDANNRVTLVVDTAPPTIAVGADKANLRSGQTATISFSLSEPSTNFVASDVTVSGGSLANFTGSGTSYSAVFYPATNSTISGVIRVASGVFTDAAGNSNADGSDANNSVTLTVNTVQVDTIPPTISISADKTSLSAGQTATISFTLSEPSTNFVASDVTVSGGTLSSFNGSGTVYTAIFTPAANSTASGGISVASGAFTDAAGNQNADGFDANNRVTLAVDNVVYARPGASTTNYKIIGDSGDDILRGIAGNDTLDGGLGSDTLTGGGGADRFVFSTKLGPTNVDTITDFASGVDKIQLAKGVFTKFKAGSVAEANFVSGANALDSNDYLIFNGSQLLYDADGSGKGAAVVVAKIVGTVVASDLFVA